MAGRKPKPTKLKLLQGNPGRRKLSPDEPEPKAMLPPAPEHLDEEAVAEWQRMGEKLHKLGLVTEIDKSALAVYCMAWSRWVEAEGKIKEFGSVMISPKSGFLVQSPYLQIANRSMEQMMKVLVEFGMTPSSRSRIHVAPRQEEVNPLERFRRGSKRSG
jgi:P27 family predicted phage terminase small subunit